MSALIVLGIYLVGWLGAAATAMRQMADRFPESENRNYGGSCGKHDFWGWGCWRGDGTIGQREAIVGSLAAVLWPLLWLPAAAYLLANQRPTPRAMENRIAELEREVGIR